MYNRLDEVTKQHKSGELHRRDIDWLIVQANQKQGIEWENYDQASRKIVSHTDHLVTNGHRTLIAQHASVPGTGKYSWMINNTLIDWVTHYAKINLPTN